MMKNFLGSNRKNLMRMLASIQPIEYTKTRNFLDGAVTHLSSYFTHGVLSPAEVIASLIIEHGEEACDKLLSEFAWREYYHRVWQSRGDDIFKDLRCPQEGVAHTLVPRSIVDVTLSSGVHVLDEAVKNLVNDGYLHNHERLWLAGVIVNTGRTHWVEPAKWLFYHLLDGDLASNTLSWQWVAGSFSQKKYIANQDNLNRFSGTEQHGTWLDISYEELSEMRVPALLEERSGLNLFNEYPESNAMPVLVDDDVILYSIWNLDEEWRSGMDGRRILLIEPSIYDSFPMSPKRWEFIMKWAAAIDTIEIYVGEFDQLIPEGYIGDLYYREYPLCNHWRGIEDTRDWIYPETSGYYQSFSKYNRLARRRSEFYHHE